MERRDTFSFRTQARRFVDEADAGRLAARERGVEIVDGKADVMDARTPVGDEPADGCVRGVGVEELHQRFAGVYGTDFRAVGVVEWHFGHAEDVAIEWYDGVEGCDRDADVGNAGWSRSNVGHGSALEEGAPALKTNSVAATPMAAGRGEGCRMRLLGRTMTSIVKSTSRRVYPSHLSL